MNFPPPHLLAKIRSDDLMNACAHMPCTLRIASFVGRPCAHTSTVVGCHLPTIGKGTGTKVSDIFVAAGCSTCHDLLDMRDNAGLLMREKYPAAFFERLMKANHETIAMWIMLELIQIPSGEQI